MKLQFTVRHEFGRDRYYATNSEARAIVELTGRKCLKDVEVTRLQHAGFRVAVVHETKQWELSRETK